MLPQELEDLELVWPKGKDHYLSPSLNHLETDMAEDVTPDEAPLSPGGRDLAARALLGGADCSAKRVSELLGVSRRTLGRMVGADLTAALQDAQILEAARTYLDASTSRGIALEERDAAATWLDQALRDDRPVPAASHRTTSVRAKQKPAPRVVTKKTPAPKVAIRPTNGTPAVPAFSLPQIETLERQQQRIVRRSALLNYVLVAEQRNGATLTLGDALTELVADISDAARTIGTILHPVPSRHP